MFETGGVNVKKCPNASCGYENDDESQYCIKCGNGLTPGEAQPNTGEGSSSSSKAIIIAAAVIGVLIIAGALLFTQLGQPSFDASANNAGKVSSQVAVKSSVDAYTWEELAAIANEIELAGGGADSWDVAKKYNLCTPDSKLDGSQLKTIYLQDGTKTQVQIIDFMHDEKTSGGKAGITFLFKDCVAVQKMNKDYLKSGGWRDSDLRDWLNGVFVNELLPRDMLNVMVLVDKETNNKGEARDVSCVTKTSDLMWVPSAVELCSEIHWASDKFSYANDICSIEGSGYRLFRDIGVNCNKSNPILAKGLPSGEAETWWLRTSRARYGGYFYHVEANGNPHKFDYADNSYGVAPGFCI